MNHGAGRTPADFFAFLDVNLPNGFMRHLRHLAALFEERGFATTLIGYSNELDRSADPARSQIRELGTLATLRFFLSAVGRIIFGRGVVVLSTQANHLQAFLAAAAWIRRRPIVYDMQDPTPESFGHLYGNRVSPFLLGLGTGWLRISERTICTMARVVCVVSPGMQTLVARRTGARAKIFLFPNVHSVAASEDARRFRLPTLVYAGGLQPRFRGIEIQLETLSTPKAGTWNIVIAGEGSRDWLDRIASERNLGRRMRVLGFIAPKRVRELLRRCHVCVVEGVEYGLPSKFFECVTSGVVVVSPTSAKDVNFVLNSSAITFDGSPDGLADALERAWNDLDAIRVRQRRFTADFLATAGHELTRLGNALSQLRQP